MQLHFLYLKIFKNLKLIRIFLCEKFSEILTLFLLLNDFLKKKYLRKNRLFCRSRDFHK